MKVQKEFEGGRYIASSLRNRVKKGPDMPTLQHSAKTNQADKDREQNEFQSRYEAQMNHHCIANEKFENEWVKAYSLIYDNFCLRDMQVVLKELPEFDVRIRDNPLELLKEAEKLSHVPRKAAYPVLALVETLTGMLTLKQGERKVYYTSLSDSNQKRM